MLTTLLSIGSVLRNQPGSGSLRHHRYIKSLPRPTKGQSLHYVEVEVAEDMTFDITQRHDIESDHTQGELYYLNYKSSDSDTRKAYIFGDICRQQEKKPKDDFYQEKEVNFVLGNPLVKGPYQQNSFDRASADISEVNNARINAFRTCLESQMEALYALFEQEPSLYINFRFLPERRHWYQLSEEFESINRALLSKFVEPAPPHGYVLSKALYKALASGKANAPDFLEENSYKSWVFPNMDSVQNLLYAIDYSQKALLRKGDIKIVVLPRSDDSTGISSLKAQDIQNFFELTTIQNIEERIQSIAKREENIGSSSPLEKDEEEYTLEITDPYRRTENNPNITQFDFIFSKASSSPSTPDIDVVELAGVSKSRIGQLHSQLQQIKSVLNAERKRYYDAKGWNLKKEPPPFQIMNAFNNILGEVGREKKKFSSHLLKTLPQIYCGTYTRDDLLLPAYISTVEYSIREGQPKHDYLRFDLQFLYRLQQENQGGSSMMDDIQSTNSYRIGQLLGKIARPLREKINSFEKNYVGLVSRRVSNVSDVVEFLNFMDQKLILHERAYPDLKAASREIVTTLANLKETYNKEYCVFGFFESYFEPAPNRKGSSTDEDPENPTENEEN